MALSALGLTGSRRAIHATPKIRFPAPFPVDARVRGKAESSAIDEKRGGWYEVVTRFTLEEGNEKPCFKKTF